uniref:Uncharacterized protein n=1 Tax=Oryza punctata TaxID=4537 RepID=A0A0E0L386_ORYPU
MTESPILNYRPIISITLQASRSSACTVGVLGLGLPPPPPPPPPPPKPRRCIAAATPLCCPEPVATTQSVHRFLSGLFQQPEPDFSMSSARILVGSQRSLNLGSMIHESTSMFSLQKQR